MQSNLLNMIGLGNLDIAYIFIGIIVVILILIVMLIVQGVKFKNLRKKYEQFMQGKDGKSLESQFAEVFEKISYLTEVETEDRSQINILIEKMKSSYQKTGLVKYDAFHEMGGKLSFSLCLLDEEDNGYIINSVHSNNGCYVYTKEIIKGASYIDLGDEEKEALQQAVSNSKSKENSEAVIKAASEKAEKSKEKKEEKEKEDA